MWRLTVEQISAFVQVDFKVGHFDVELKVFFHWIDVIEDVVDNPGDDALHGWVIDDALHCMGLARWSLPVSKYGSVVATQDICEGINIE